MFLFARLLVLPKQRQQHVTGHVLPHCHHGLHRHCHLPPLHFDRLPRHRPRVKCKDPYVVAAAAVGVDAVVPVDVANFVNTPINMHYVKISI